MGVFMWRSDHEVAHKWYEERNCALSAFGVLLVLIMDAGLEKAVQEIMVQDGVVGLLMADGNGLCVIAKGVAQASSSGYLSSLVNRAADLGSDEPVVCVESDGHQIFIRKQEDLVVAVYKALK